MDNKYDYYMKEIENEVRAHIDMAKEVLDRTISLPIESVDDLGVVVEIRNMSVYILSMRKLLMDMHSNGIGSSKDDFDMMMRLLSEQGNPTGVQ